MTAKYVIMGGGDQICKILLLRDAKTGVGVRIIDTMAQYLRKRSSNVSIFFPIYGRGINDNLLSQFMYEWHLLEEI